MAHAQHVSFTCAGEPGDLVSQDVEIVKDTTLSMTRIFRRILPGWGLVCGIACWAPPIPKHPLQACLHRVDVPHDSPLEGQSTWDFDHIRITYMQPNCKASRCLFDFIFQTYQCKSKICTFETNSSRKLRLKQVIELNVILIVYLLI